ncbi:mechanosensitive ion channel protein 10-like [Punica granatum]|uniref:Mechanosensitive ion channel protein n=1 Tax=Punica granatum TaxID=22663 RepID=A0A6P8BTA9_PUNGR|nr:mechanosensitive ion channel protein 10-like [Punica granatum]
MEVTNRSGAEGKEINEVVVVISGGERQCNSSPSAQTGPSSRATAGLTRLNTRLSGCSPQESVKSSPCPTPGKPPRSPGPAGTLTRRTILRSSFSKPKSRFEEPKYTTNVEEKTRLKNWSASPIRSSPQNMNVRVGSPKDNIKSVPVTPRTPSILLGSDGEDEEDDEDDEVYKTANLKVQEMCSNKKYNKAVLLEWAAFVCIMGVLIVSLTVHRMRYTEIWGLRLWRWCVLVLVIFCGRLVSEWFINVLVFLIEINFLLKKKVLYFVFGLKKSVQAFLWIALVLLAWGLLISRSTKRSKNTMRIVNHITRGLAAGLIGAAIWLVKTLLIKLLASSFQCKRFFDRIQESIFHQYIVRTLSGLPLMEMAERVGKSDSSGRLSFRKVKKDSAREDVIDVDKLHTMKLGKVSAWTMKGLIDVIGGSGLSTLSETLDDEDDDEGKKNKEITNEWEAKAAAYRIFMNVAKPGSKYIKEEDLLRFMEKKDVDNVIPLFEGAAEKRKIKRSALKNWLIKVYRERKSLAHSLNDAKTAIEELNKLVSGILVIVIIIVWLLMMGFLTTEVLVFILSQLLLAVFVFGNTAKTVFEAIIFVFMMHPFDVGDRCVINGVQMVVEEVNLLTTVFLKYDNEKIFYPNSVLATKPISNFYRSPEMTDSVEFAIDFSTSVESIAALKGKIKSYIDGKPKHWHPGHSVMVEEIEDVNKLKLRLSVTHTINFQNYGDKSSRRSDLILELKRIFEGLNIKYHLLPQEAVVSNAGPLAASAR